MSEYTPREVFEHLGLADREAKLEQCRRRTGQPLIALTPDQWEIVLRSLDRAVENEMLDWYKDSLRETIERIEDQL